VNVVRGFYSLARMVENSFCDMAFDAQPRKPRPPSAPKVMRRERSDTVLLESLEASGDAARDVFRIDRRRLVDAGKYEPRSARGACGKGAVSPTY